jgi:hypothetical protein
MFADEFRRAVAIAIADARSSFAQEDVAECDARAGHGQFTNGLHGTPLPRAGLDVPTVPEMTVCRARGALRFTVAQLNFRREGLRDILPPNPSKSCVAILRLNGARGRSSSGVQEMVCGPAKLCFGDVEPPSGETPLADPACDKERVVAV